MPCALRFHAAVLGCVPGYAYPNLGMVQVWCGSALIVLWDGTHPGATAAILPVPGGRNVDHVCIATSPFAPNTMRAHPATHTATTFPISLLDDPDLIFARTGDSGGLLNSKDGAVGISNTFGRNPLSALAALAQARWPGFPVVLWQGRPDTADLKAARFQRLVPMRVWFPLSPG